MFLVTALSVRSSFFLPSLSLMKNLRDHLFVCCNLPELSTVLRQSGALFVLMLFVAVTQAAQVQHLTTQSATASGAGDSGTPSIASFSIPAGKNRVLFIWAGFERDHISAADASGGLGTDANTAGTGLGDNYPEPRTGTPPATTTNNQLTARVVGPSGTINKKDALVIGGTPSGDTRFVRINRAPTGSPAGTAFFSVENFHIVLF
jgi:hypothetical protein